MKIERDNKPPIVIGQRVVLGQAIMGAINAGVMMYNWTNPLNPIPGEFAAMAGQPIVFFAQVWWANRYGVTTA